MKKIIRNIAGLLTLAAVSACSAGFDLAVNGPTIIIHGSVTDTIGSPLNHIKVTLDYGDEIGQMTVYTSLRGEFIADMEPETTVLKITMEDIDGDENGGSFETMTDHIMILDHKLSNEDIIMLEYRLNHATVSESNPQSL